MENKVDILDLLEDTDGFVMLTKKNGQIEFGWPDVVFFCEDENGWETKKRIHFVPYYSKHYVDYGLEDIESFMPIDEADIPPYE